MTFSFKLTKPLEHCKGGTAFLEPRCHRQKLDNIRMVEVVNMVPLHTTMNTGGHGQMANFWLAGHTPKTMSLAWHLSFMIDFSGFLTTTMDLILMRTLNQFYLSIPLDPLVNRMDIQAPRKLHPRVQGFKGSTCLQPGEVTSGVATWLLKFGERSLMSISIHGQKLTHIAGLATRWQR